MKYSDKQLLNLIRAGDDVLDNPTDDAAWGRYLQRLDEIERDEAAQLASHERAPFAARRLSLLPAAFLTAAAVIGLIGVWFFSVRDDFRDVLSPGAASTLALETLTLPPTQAFTPDPRPTLAVGQMAGELTETRLTTQHGLAVHAGDIVSIRLDAVGFDAYLTLLDVNGEELVSNDDCVLVSRACVEAEITVDGVYTVVVDSFDRRSIGTYTLTVGIDVALTPIPDSTPTLTPVTANCPDAGIVARVVTDQSRVNLRNGPNASFTGAGIAYPGECFEAVGRNAESTWIRIRLATGRQAWLLARFLEFTGTVDSLPVLDQ